MDKELLIVTHYLNKAPSLLLKNKDLPHRLHERLHRLHTTLARPYQTPSGKTETKDKKWIGFEKRSPVIATTCPPPSIDFA
ncbi:hypothetical protein GWI33_007302 [Rhynchophorus ferrugineus]|uniref:Uncharacterized protein n=1 Tax=Rhynchophorus ferrugineus TaxID=354439 RepID=A0A834MCA4_RHYFE|nr:hypothetical protein GWI33_007302 [Rhynchophorus ferrugineus]